MNGKKNKYCHLALKDGTFSFKAGLSVCSLRMVFKWLSRIGDLKLQSLLLISWE